MASKFIGTFSWAGGRGMKIEDATAIQRFSPCHFVILNTDFTNYSILQGKFFNFQGIFKFTSLLMATLENAFST